jgi:prephenate dehydrogenase
VTPAPAGPFPGGPFPNGVVIVGTGLIGTSVGLALSERGIQVWLTDRDPAAAALAASLGAGKLLDTGFPSTPPVTPTPSVPAVPAVPPAPPATLAVLAVPPDVVAPTLAAAQAAGLATCYTDVASVKSHPLAAARALGGDLTCYVPGHPLAGRERSGPAAARADLFLGRPWALCPTPQNTPDALACVTALVEACGAKPVTVEAAEHDRWVALVSHAPHLVASAMAARLAGAPAGALTLAGQGLRDATRIAAGDPALWTQILTANAAGVAEVVAAVAEDLRRAAAALAQADTATLAALLDDGVAGVGRIPGKHAGPATQYSIVQVVIPDRPGELARLFQAAGEAGVNIEDIRIEHSPGLPVGVAELAVRPDAARSLGAALAEYGWPVSLVPRVN